MEIGRGSMNLVIGKLYMVTSMTTRGIMGDNGGMPGSHIGTLRSNDIVLFLGELNKSWLKILTSDGIIGYVSCYDCKLEEAV